MPELAYLLSIHTIIRMHVSKEDTITLKQVVQYHSLIHVCRYMYTSTYMHVIVKPSIVYYNSSAVSYVHDVHTLIYIIAMQIATQHRH